MTRRRRQPKVRMLRQEARARILDVANKTRVDPAAVPPYRMAHIQRAVSKVRRRRLVSADVLVAAGFRGDRS